MENQLKESSEKMNDLRIQQGKENESLQTEIKDLRETLSIREKCHTKQKDIFKKMAANSQSELDKARAVISNLSEGMKGCEGKSNVQSQFCRLPQISKKNVTKDQTITRKHIENTLKKNHMVETEVSRSYILCNYLRSMYDT